MAKQSPSPAPSPVDFLLDNQEVIMKAHQESGGKHKKTWTLLEQSLPEMAKSMSFSTFKQYLPVFLAVNEKISQQLADIKQECVTINAELASTREACHDLESRLDRVEGEKRGLIGELAASAGQIESLKDQLVKYEEDLSECGGPESPVAVESGRPFKVLGWTVAYSCGCLTAWTRIAGKLYSLSASRSPYADEA